MKFIFTDKELEKIKQVAEGHCFDCCYKCPLNTILNGEVCCCNFVAKKIIKNKKNNTVEIKCGNIWNWV